MPKKKKQNNKTTETAIATRTSRERSLAAVEKSSHEALDFMGKLAPNLHHMFDNPEHMIKFCRKGYLALKKNPKLMNCGETLGHAIEKAASLKLELGGALGHCYPIPFRDNKKNATTCQLIIGYRGWVKLILLHSHGYVKWITADVVRKGDKFREIKGTTPRIEHEALSDDAELTHAYFVAGLANGQTVFKVLSKATVMKSKRCSRGAFDRNGKPVKSHPWNNENEPEMWKKTAVIMGGKLLPIDTEEYSTAMEHEHSLHEFDEEEAPGSVTVLPPEGGGNDKLKQAIAPSPADEPLTVTIEEEVEEEQLEAEGEPPESKPQGAGFQCGACGHTLASYGETKAVCINRECEAMNDVIDA